MKKVGIYCRVSSSEQVKNDSLETQQTNGINFCTQHKYDFQIYRDEGKSGNDIDKRTAYQDLIEDIRNRVLTGIWVVNIDRLNRNLGNSQEFLSIALLYDIDVYENGIRMNLGDTNERLGYNIKSMFAEYTRENIRKTVITSKLRKLNDGYNISGATPFGYFRDGNELKIEKEEAIIIRDIFNLLLQGYSRNAVSAELKLKYGNKYKRKGYGKTLNFNPVWIGRLIKLDYYVEGLWEYKFLEAKSSIKCEPIIERGLFNKVHLMYRIDRGKRDKTFSSYLEGKMVCWRCEKKMILIKHKGWKRKDGTQKLYHYFQCQDKECKNIEWRKKNIRVEEYEERVESYINKFILNADFFRNEMKDLLIEEIERKQKVYNRDIKSYNTIHKKIKKQKDFLIKLNDVYLNSDVMNQDEYFKRVKEVKSEIASLNSSIDNNIQPDISHVIDIEKEISKYDGDIKDFLKDRVVKIIVEVLTFNPNLQNSKGRIVKLRFVFKGMNIGITTLHHLNTSHTSNIIKPQKVSIFLTISHNNKGNGVEVEIEYCKLD